MHECSIRKSWLILNFITPGDCTVLLGWSVSWNSYLHYIRTWNERLYYHTLHSHIGRHKMLHFSCKHNASSCNSIGIYIFLNQMLLAPEINPTLRCLFYNTLTGFIQARLCKIHGLFKDFQKTLLLFSRTENLRKILIYMLKFYFGNARVHN